MRTQVFAAGRLAADETGRLFIRHRADPYEIDDDIEASLAEAVAARAAAREEWQESSTAPGRWSLNVHDDAQFVEVLDPNHLAGDLLTRTEPLWTGIVGTVDEDAIEGRTPPVITLEGLAPYPATNRDGWDELDLNATTTSATGAVTTLTTAPGTAACASADTEFLVVEGTPDFHRPGPSLVVSGNHPFKKADLDLAWAAHQEIDADPLWDGTFSSGGGMVEGKGHTVHLGVPIVTDAMRDWLRSSDHLVYVRPIAQRPAGH